jgi:hypothetical protein
MELQEPADPTAAVPLEAGAQLGQPLGAILGHSSPGEIQVKSWQALTDLQGF